jgi:hypothetical protein
MFRAEVSMKDRTFHRVEVDRSLSAARMLERYEAAGYEVSARVAAALSAIRREPGDAYAAELTLFNPGGLEQAEGIIQRIQRAELRQGDLYEGMEFAIQHGEAFRSALPLIVFGTRLRLPGKGHACIAAFDQDGARLEVIERADFWGAVNFLAARL